MEKDSKYAKFCYSEEDEELVDILKDYLDEKAESIFEFFDTTLSRDKVEIHIIPTKEEYDKSLSKRTGRTDIQKWSIGNCHDGIIEYVSLNDYKNTSHAFPIEKYDKALDNYKKTIVHEYVHYVLGLYLKKNNVDYTRKYLIEGIAQYLSNQREKLKMNITKSLEEILNRNDCYEEWLLMTKYIIEKYGREYFLELVLNKEKSFQETNNIYEESKEYYKKMF